jgi:hypothetical protein
VFLRLAKCNKPQDKAAQVSFARRNVTASLNSNANA